MTLMTLRASSNCGCIFRRRTINVIESMELPRVCSKRPHRELALKAQTNNAVAYQRNAPRLRFCTIVYTSLLRLLKTY